MNKKISFKNSKGQLLVGVLHLPRGKGPFPIVIVCHGFKGNHDSRLVKNMALQLVKERIAVLRFTFSGHKPSGGGYKEVLVSQFLRDVKNGIKFLQKVPQIDKNRVGIAGHSMGGFTALMSVSSLSSKLKLLVSISSLYDVTEIIESYRREKRVLKEEKDYFIIKDRTQNLKVTRNHFKDCLYLKENYLISKIKCPVLVIHGDKDKRVLVKDAYTIYRLLKNEKKLVIIKNADHGFSDPRHLDKVIKLTVNWFKKYL